jgi:hypothetical protein
MKSYIKNKKSYLSKYYVEQVIYPNWRIGINTSHGHSPDIISVSGFSSTITFEIYLL